MRYKYLAIAVAMTFVMSGCSEGGKKKSDIGTIESTSLVETIPSKDPESVENTEEAINEEENIEAPQNSSANEEEKTTPSPVVSPTKAADDKKSTPQNTSTASTKVVSPTPKPSEKPKATPVVKTTNATGNKNTQETPRPKENGSRQFERADITGEVAVISSSSITIKVIKTPSFERRERPETEEGSASPKPRGEGKGENRQTLQYTGEEKTFTVSEAIPVTMLQRGENGMETVKALLKDIKAGDRLSIYYLNDGKTIAKMNVMPKR